MSVIEYGIVVAVSVRAPRHARFGLNSDCHPARSPIRAATFLDPPAHSPHSGRLLCYAWFGGWGVWDLGLPPSLLPRNAVRGVRRDGVRAVADRE
jgi:hypothetical protein